MSKRIVEIGDVFGSWKVIGLEINERKYNYNYICKCDCGNKKVIRKDKLVNFTFPKCEKCLNNGIIDRKMDIIRSRWNTLVNGKLVLSDLDVLKSYSWKCEHGHIYQSNLLLLNEICPICKSKSDNIKNIERMQKNFDLLVDYLDKVCDEVFDDVNISIDEDLFLIKLEINDFIIFMSPKIHRSYNEISHGTKNNYYNILNTINAFKKSVVEDQREHIFIELILDTKDKAKVFESLKHVAAKVSSNCD